MEIYFYQGEEMISSKVQGPVFPSDSPPGISPIHSSIPGPQGPSDSFSAWERTTNHVESLKNVINNLVILLLGFTLSQWFKNAQNDSHVRCIIPWLMMKSGKFPESLTRAYH